MEGGVLAGGEGPAQGLLSLAVVWGAAQQPGASGQLRPTHAGRLHGDPGALLIPQAPGPGPASFFVFVTSFY